jgi:hypothetical protein
MVAIIKKESDDTHIYFKLFVWNGLNYVNIDSNFIFWDDAYEGHYEFRAIKDMLKRNNINKYQII